MRFIDWGIVILYFVSIATVGLVVSLRVKDTENYFLGKRRFGKWLMIGQSFGTGTHAEMPVSLAGAVYVTGASAIWYQWKNMFATPFYWILAPILRRIRRTTIAELVEDRYGPWMGGIYTVFALAFFTINSGSMLKGAAKVINQAVGGHIGVNRIVIAMTVVFLLYSFVGGLVASAWTDFFNGFLVIVLSFMLIPLGWGIVGGMAGMKATLPAFNFSLATPQGIGIWTIVVLTLNGLIGTLSQPHVLATVGTGKDEATCRAGFLYGTYTKRFCTVGWALLGLMVAAMVMRGSFGITSLADPEDAFGFACRHLLFPGALGLLIATVLAANMSACSAFMVDSGALFTQGFYRKRVRPRQADSHYLWVGRISGLVIALFGVLYALFLIKRVLYSFLLTETLATYMGICIIGGIIWPRANRWGAVASFVVALGTNFSLYYLRNERLDNWDPTVFLLSLLAGGVSLVVVSLLTSPEPQRNVASFLGRLQTPSASLPPEAGRPSGAGLDQGQEDLAWENKLSPEPSRATAEKGEQLLLVNLLHLRKATCGLGFLKAYRVDLVGLGIGWALAIILVGAVWVMFRL